MERKWDRRRRRRLWSTASQFGEDMGIEMDLLSNELALTNHLFIYGAKVLMIKLNKSPSAALSLPHSHPHTTINNNVLSLLTERSLMTEIILLNCRPGVE